MNIRSAIQVLSGHTTLPAPPRDPVDVALDQLDAARKLANAEQFARDMYEENLELRATINMALTCLACGASDSAAKLLAATQRAR